MSFVIPEIRGLDIVASLEKRITDLQKEITLATNTINSFSASIVNLTGRDRDIAILRLNAAESSLRPARVELDRLENEKTSVIATREEAITTAIEERTVQQVNRDIELKNREIAVNQKVLDELDEKLATNRARNTICGVRRGVCFSPSNITSAENKLLAAAQVAEENILRLKMEGRELAQELITAPGLALIVTKSDFRRLIRDKEREIENIETTIASNRAAISSLSRRRTSLNRSRNKEKRNQARGISRNIRNTTERIRKMQAQITVKEMELSMLQRQLEEAPDFQTGIAQVAQPVEKKGLSRNQKVAIVGGAGLLGALVLL